MERINDYIEDINNTIVTLRIISQVFSSKPNYSYIKSKYLYKRGDILYILRI